MVDAILACLLVVLVGVCALYRGTNQQLLDAIRRMRDDNEGLQVRNEALHAQLIESRVVSNPRLTPARKSARLAAVRATLVPELTEAKYDLYDGPIPRPLDIETPRFDRPGWVQMEDERPARPQVEVIGVVETLDGQREEITRCLHAEAIAVESVVTGEVLAHWCEACQTQLPAKVVDPYAD